NAGLHAPVLQDAAQRPPPEQGLEQPRHAEGEAVERAADEVGEVVADLGEAPLPELLVAVAVQSIDLGAHLGEVVEMELALRHIHLPARIGEASDSPKTAGSTRYSPRAASFFVAAATRRF